MTELWLDATDDWRSHAACRRMVAAAYPEDRQYIANLWHPVRGDCEGPDATEAMAVCNGIPGEKAACPVRAECLATYLNQKHGVFGGTTRSSGSGSAPTGCDAAGVAPSESRRGLGCDGHLHDEIP